MKTLVLFLLFVLFSCSPELRIYTDTDPAYDLKTFKTFDWLEKTNIEANKNPIYYNELNDKRIKSAVEKELAARGYLLSEVSPDLLLHYHIMLDDKAAMIPEHEASSYGPYWLQSPSYTYVYKEGTLLIDMMDSKNNLVWRGSASSPIEEVYSPERSSKLINIAVERIFKAFPATKK